MKPPSDKMGGGYRRKADQDTLGRNSRLRYSYLPSDPRMIPYSSARLRENQNKPIGRTLKSDMGKNTVAANFDLSNYDNGVHPSKFERVFDVLITDVSALVGTLYRIEVELEVLANPVLGTSAYSQTLLLATSIGRTYINSQIDSTGYLRIGGAEYQITSQAHKHQTFQARRIRVLCYNIDSGSPVLEAKSDFTEYFCYSPVVGIVSPIDASIVYDGQVSTVFDANSFSTNSKIVSRFENISYTGDSYTRLFKLRFEAESTSSTSTQVVYTETIAFDPTNNPVPLFELELLQPDGPIYENYMVNNLNVRLEPAEWPSAVRRQLGYGWDIAWESAANMSPSSLTTFNIIDAEIRLIAGQTLTNPNPWKFFKIQLDSLNATNVASVGNNIDSNYIIQTLRSGKNQYSEYIALVANEDPATSAPTVLHNNVLRTYGATGDDIQGPVIATLRTQWTYTGVCVLNKHPIYDQVAVPPYFNTISLQIQNENESGYDIVVTAFDAFTAFNQNGASGETPFWTIELTITDNSANLLYQQTTQYDGTVPFPLKQVSRSTNSPDLSWFPTTYSGTHNISLFVKYSFATNGFILPINTIPASPFVLYSAGNLLTTNAFYNQTLDDLIPPGSLNNISNPITTITEVTYHVSGSTSLDVSKAFNYKYQATTSNEEWMVGTPIQNSDMYRLWAWIDLGQSRTIKRFRFWQNDVVTGIQHRVKNVMLAVSNNLSDAQAGHWGGVHFYNSGVQIHRQNSALFYTDNTGAYNLITNYGDASYNDIGSTNDSTISLNKSATTGFWEMRFEYPGYFPEVNRTGRYLYFRMDRRSSGGHARVMQCQVFGY